MDVLQNLAHCPETSTSVASTFLALMSNVLVGSYCNISASSMWPSDYGPRALLVGLQEYDFIVVGGGAAGAVVANRLSENSSWRILLLEAGDNPPVESEVPALVTTLIDSAFDWRFLGESAINTGFGLKEGIRYSRGRMLGGSTGLNFMFYARGNSRDYNNWAEAGNPTWDWDSVLKYFKKSENMIDDKFLTAYGGKYHAAGGLLNIDNFHYNNPVKDLMFEALQEIGVKKLIDLHSEEFIGTAEVAGTIAFGSRQSSAKAFLSSAKNRPNLHVIKNAFVTSLEINVAGRVSGVNFLLNRAIPMRARASKEYILSAGVFGSAKILLLSGIGPVEHLTSLGIRTWSDLKVGHNFEDHPGCVQVFKVPSNDTDATYSSFYNSAQYLLEKKGPLSSVMDMSTYINVNNDSSLYPDTQIFYFMYKSGQILETSAGYSMLGYDETVTRIDSPMVSASLGNAIILSMVALLNPKSRGRVELRSRNPLDPPKIISQLFQHDDDIKTVIKGLKFQRDLLKTAAYSKRGVAEVNFTPNRCRGKDRNSDDFLDCWVRHFGTSLYHPTGTCKMGPAQDKSAVVDPKLTVHGFENLRVIDASIMPNVISGNTMAATIMIGEKGSDFIKDKWNCNCPST